uniref:Cytochrome C n=1 Tax=Paulinella longichromatophora TaxID=1708747 RepID=A0A2H4ZNB0_9EUKA|nr:cytochrome C [Paulinella longichromatophora]
MTSYILLVLLMLSMAMPVFSLDGSDALSTGAHLFENHCVGCHANGKNIIRRSKTLFKSDLCKQSIFDIQSIATIARAGIGQMTGYESELNFNEAQEISSWIYLQALNDWDEK